MSELRKDPIIGRWVIVATERAKRPNDFESNGYSGKDSAPLALAAGGDSPEAVLKRYQNSKIIPDNNFLPDAGGTSGRPGFGIHRLISEEKIRDLELKEGSGLEPVFCRYKKEILALEKKKHIKYAVIFKNYKVKTNSQILRYPFGNLIGLPVYFKNIKREIKGALAYYQKNKRCIYCDILSQELKSKKRFILQNSAFAAITPFASRFPLEVWVLPKKHSSDYARLSSSQLKDLASLVKKIISKLKSLLGDFPYTYILHTGPLGISKTPEVAASYHWYLEIIPLLTRVAGFEWGTGFYINPMPPELTAEYLKKAAEK